MVDIFDEINEDLRAERAQALLKRYGLLMIAALVLVLIGVGGWQAWRWRQTTQTGQVAAVFLDAMRKAAPGPAGLPAGLDVQTPARTEALTSFTDLAATAPDGYRTLARLQAAALRTAAGDRPAARAMLDEVSADTAADPLLRGLADLLWVQGEVDDGAPDAVEGRLAGLLTAGNAWRPMAMEAQAWLLMRTGREDQARDMLKQLQADPAAPKGVQDRAGLLLVRLGGTPAGLAAGAGG